MDRQGILWYLLIVLVLSTFVEVVCLVFPGLSYISYSLLLWPALAAWIARRKSTLSSAYPAPLISNVPRRTAIRTAVVVPLLFMLAFLITTALGLSRPDWTLGTLMMALPKQPDLPPHIASSYPLLVLVMGFAITTALGPTIYALALLGNEYGWRGYLLPRLIPLGKWNAYGITNFLWILTFIPLFAFGGRNTGLMLPMYLLLALVVGILLSQIWEKTAHIGLTAICAGAILVQVFGMWPYLFPMARRSLPWSGTISISTIIVFAIVALCPQVFFGRLTQRPSASSDQGQPAA